MSRLRNGCGQAVAATLLRHWSCEPEATPASVYAAHPPDTPLAIMGTTPRGLARILDAHGLAVERHAGRDPHRSAAWLRASLARGPVALCVDLRPLGSRLPMLHWILAEEADDHHVACSHLVRTRWRSPRARVPWPDLQAAWRCGWMPHRDYWHAGLLVHGST